MKHIRQITHIQHAINIQHKIHIKQIQYMKHKMYKKNTYKMMYHDMNNTKVTITGMIHGRLFYKSQQ